jgi:hypothetical protein
MTVPIFQYLLGEERCPILLEGIGEWGVSTPFMVNVVMLETSYYIEE